MKFERSEIPANLQDAMQRLASGKALSTAEMRDIATLSRNLPSPIADYIDHAKKVLSLATDTQLAAAIPMTKPRLSLIRKGKEFPKDQEMMRLCELAEIDPQIGLMELNYLRSEEPARTVYAGLLHRLTKTAAAFALIPALILGNLAATGAHIVNLSDAPMQSHHYGK